MHNLHMCMHMHTHMHVHMHMHMHMHLHMHMHMHMHMRNVLPFRDVDACLTHDLHLPRLYAYALPDVPRGDALRRLVES
jgi:hypothetical protein